MNDEQITKVICTQAKTCSQRDRCLAAKPHHPRLCGKPCSVDALAECVAVEDSDTETIEQEEI